MSLNDAEKQVNSYLKTNIMVITELLEQLKQEKKFKGAYEVAKYLKDQADNIED